MALAIQLVMQSSGLVINFSDSSFFGITARGLITVLIFALVEELVKFGAAYASIHADPAFDEPIDAMIYMIIAALGFATIENIGAVQRDLSLAGNTMAFQVVAETLALRFVGATLLHTLSSGLVGYYWAIHIRNFGKGSALLFGLASASLLHAFFNYLILTYGNLIYAVAFVVVLGFYVLGDFEKLRLKSI